MTTHTLRRLRLCLLGAALAALAPAASAQAANFLQLGAVNNANTPTTLTGITSGGPELTVVNTSSVQPALKAQASGASAGAFGVFGLLTTLAPTGNSAAVRGQNNATNGLGYGVWGSHAGSGSGVYGASVDGPGVTGRGTLDYGGRFLGGNGVFGTASFRGGYGVVGRADSGVLAHGVDGRSATGIGVYGSGPLAGVEGTSQTSDGIGVRGGHTATTGTGPGVRGYTNSTSSNAYGVYGLVTSSSANSGSAGVYGHNNSIFSTGAGVLGTHSGTGVGVDGVSSGGVGVYGATLGGKGVYGFATSGTGVYAHSGSGEAGYFDGNVHVSGSVDVNDNVHVGGFLSKSAGSFRIDHPLDPARKYLQHSFVESPDMKNVYDGMVVTDRRGFATVTMPRWFHALNNSFRYQLTIVGRSFAQAIVWRELAHNRFTIRTNAPRVKVSWQVTGIRHDPYANDHRVKVEVPKAAGEQGKYVYPQGYGKSKRDTVGYQRPQIPSSKR
jgi:hypothetical protein